MKNTARAKLKLRFEDIAQDGRILVSAFQHFLGATTWPAIFEHAWARALRDEGVVPILTHVALEGTEGPFSAVGDEIDVEGRWELGHAKNEAGEVERLLVSMWIEARAPLGRTYGPAPKPEIALAGKVYAEHVVTRLFAPPDQRKVTRLDVDGLAPVPEKELVFTSPESVSIARGEVASAYEETTVFGLTHTDSNQHVNSLVYQRMFEEAVVRHTKNGSLLCRSVRMGYRKPFFAGDVARIDLVTWQEEGHTCASGTFSPVSGGKPHVHVSMRF